MGLKTRGWGLLAAVLLVLNIPVLTEAHEERPVSMEAILEELASLRSIVEAQQKQIEQLQAAVRPADVAMPIATAATSSYAQQTPAPADGPEYRDASTSGRNNGFG